MPEGGDTWVVTGGRDKGGIVVRSGATTSSDLLSERLATGSKVRQLQLQDDRLQYELLTGNGPAVGWVSTVLAGGKNLLEKVSEGQRFKFETPTPIVSYETPQPKHVPEEIVRKAMQPMSQDKVSEIFQHMDEITEGEFFGLPFPFTGAQILSFGPEWLTKAFHAAGSLPKGNSVKRIVGSKFFPGGGAGLKATLHVEYESPSDVLHNNLFVKLPLPPSEKNRMFTVQLAMEGQEIVFNQYFNPCLPFRTPKFYYGDMSLKTSNFILVSETLKLAEASTRGTRQEAFQFEAAPLKGMDSILNDCVAKYHALWRTNAMMAAWCHCGKLGQQMQNCSKPPLPSAFFPVTEKSFRPKWEETKDFVLNVGTGCFPKDIANEKYMAKLEPEVFDVAQNIHCFNDYLGRVNQSGVGLIHINAQVDNAFFWVDERGRTDCGLLDFGGMIKFSWMGQLLGGNILSASAEFRAYHLESASRLFVDTLAEYGGPKLDAQGFYHQIAISDFKNVTTSMTMVVSGGFGGIYDGLPKDQWSKSITMDDERWLKEDIPTLMLRNPVASLVEGIKAWKMGSYYSLFTKWREEFGKKAAPKGQPKKKT